MGLRDGQTPVVPLGRLAELLGARVHVPVALVVDGKSVAGAMRLLSRSEDAAVELGARAMLAKLEVGPLAPTTLSEWNAENAVRTLAIAVRDPDNHDQPLDTLESWREVATDDQIGKLYEQYKDLRERLDPMGPDTAELSKEDLAALRSAVKKKDVELLMSYGSRRLASFAISSAEQPAS